MKEIRLQDYIDRLTEEEREDYFATFDNDEKKLRKFLTRFDEDQFCTIADFMNDAFNMPADGLTVTEFIVTLYKCQKAGFYYKELQKLLDNINVFMLESGDSF